MWGAILINIGGDIDEGDFAVGRFELHSYYQLQIDI